MTPPASDDEDGDGPFDDLRGELAENSAYPQGEQPESPLHRLRTHRPYWVRTMHQIGMVCAMTLSILEAGYRLEWDPKTGHAPAACLRTHPSAYAESAFVSEAVAAGVAAGIMVACDRSALHCILPLGVAFNRKGKRRLIWDGRHVNRYLRQGKIPSGVHPTGGPHPCRGLLLQWQSTTDLSRCSFTRSISYPEKALCSPLVMPTDNTTTWTCTPRRILTSDSSGKVRKDRYFPLKYRASANAPSAGTFYHFVVLPFGIASAPAYSP